MFACFILQMFRNLLGIGFKSPPPLLQTQCLRKTGHKYAYDRPSFSAKSCITFHKIGFQLALFSAGIGYTFVS
jgi:hypothetical protein